jgi:hypothetical protein
MTSDQSENDKPHETPVSKRPYQPPSFRFEKVFETSALSCGKINATQAGCHLNRKLS